MVCNYGGWYTKSRLYTSDEHLSLCLATQIERFLSGRVRDRVGSWIPFVAMVTEPGVFGCQCNREGRLSPVGRLVLPRDGECTDLWVSGLCFGLSQRGGHLFQSETEPHCTDVSDAIKSRCRACRGERSERSVRTSEVCGRLEDGNVETVWWIAE